MNGTTLGVIMMGNVVASDRDRVGANTWAAEVATDLNARAGDTVLAPFDHAMSNEVQGVLAPTADPIGLILAAVLRPQDHDMASRWAVVWGGLDPGKGRATHRTGEGFLLARELLSRARVTGAGIILLTGVPGADEMLAELTPVLDSLLADLSPMGRDLAHGMLVEGRRQSDLADERQVARPTVSIAVKRAHIEDIRHLCASLRALLAAASMVRAEMEAVQPHG